MADLLTFGAAIIELTTPGRERLVTADRLDVAATGPAANAAMTAARIGSDATWLSKLPDTHLGRRAAAGIASHGVETAIRWTDEGRQGLAFAERAGPPRGNARIDDRTASAVASATPDDLPLSAVGDPELVFVDAALPTRSATLADTTATLFAELAARGTSTVLGLGSREPSAATVEATKDLLPAVDTLIATEAGAAALGDRANSAETAHTLAAENGLETVVIVRDERGGVVWDDRTVHERAPPVTETVDERGAFDAFCGGFLARRTAGAGADTALEAGVASEALARTVPGPVPAITVEEVERCTASMTEPGMDE
ncbi:PfkB family carbohydrate kinase [Halococcus saccharolyticus]|uniref:PfkB domain protein n=1 Tax=Halococcus saccharolyticus DSM 5350 TaxID=1227455 RepID=M0MG03_9EURY|nr:PfkB family carbohydrate kinase [Halococcus saccharolyticus]EMA43355.1 PfkB domain protein [Halococcus saccharolyticus DSM 5350]